MSEKTPQETWLEALREAVAAGQLVKATLSKPTAAAGDVKTIDIRPILVKRVLKLSFTTHHRTRDVVKNHAPEEAETLLRGMLGATFSAARLCSTEADVLLQHKQGAWQLQRHAPSQRAAPDLQHDRPKQRPLTSEGKPYLHALGITDAAGKVHKNAQDKFRQINKYIELLGPRIEALPSRALLRVVDMGAGKGYLTFALYDYLTHHAGMAVDMVGVEYRADLVAKCNDIAQNAGFTGLRFVEGAIADYDCSGVDVVIALHACDTATDDAIAKAMHAEAALIAVAPCCHKQIRRAMGKVGDDHPLALLLQHGTYVERMAEMLTDGMRAQLMELSGYRTQLFEFISDAHTPKNVMIVGTKKKTLVSEEHKIQMRARMVHIKAPFGIDRHHLEDLLNF